MTIERTLKKNRYISLEKAVKKNWSRERQERVCAKVRAIKFAVQVGGRPVAHTILSLFVSYSLCFTRKIKLPSHSLSLSLRIALSFCRIKTFSFSLPLLLSLSFFPSFSLLLSLSVSPLTAKFKPIRGLRYEWRVKKN